MAVVGVGSEVASCLGDRILLLRAHPEVRGAGAVIGLTVADGNEGGLNLIDGRFKPLGVLADALGDQGPVYVVVAERGAVVPLRLGV